MNDPAPVAARNVAETLFHCRDDMWDVRLLGAPDGKLVLVTNPHAMEGATAGANSNWQDIREGYLVGQQGGHQGHIRLYDGHRQIILFEGMDGDLADRPGRTYAGALTQTDANPAQDFRVECEAGETNRQLTENLRDWAERTGGPAPVPEDAGGPFDGWF